MQTTEKTCFKCSASKPLSEFYRHSRMADGHLNKCKECTKTDVKENRASRAEYYRRFDRSRANLPHRVAARSEYQKTIAYSESHAKSLRSYRSRHTERTSARNAVNNAVRDGRIEKLPCIVCGSSAEAHHPDYSLPLDVVWLCDTHHKRVHAEHRGYLRASE